MPVLLDALARTLPELLLLSLLGRVFLAWLPPGRIGSHDPAALPLTWAASWLLGGICANAAGAVAHLVDVAQLGDPDGLGGPGGTGGRMLLTGVALLLGLARFATRPAAMVPRHEVRAEPLRWPARLAGAALMAALLWRLLAIPWDPAVLECGAHPLEHTDRERCPIAAAGLVGAWVDLVALAILVAHGLERARRARLERRLLLVAGVLLSFGALPDHPTLLVGAAAALAIPWWRRADRRALALAALAFAGAGMVDWIGRAPQSAAPLGSRWDDLWLTAGAVALWAASARPARNTALAWCLPALLLVLPNAAADALAATSDGDLRALAAPALRAAFCSAPALVVFWSAAAAALLASAAGLAGGTRAGRSPASPVDDPAPSRVAADPPVREIRGLRLVLAFSALAALVPLGNSWDRVAAHVAGFTPHLMPAALCLIGLVFLRSERTAGR